MSDDHLVARRKQMDEEETARLKPTIEEACLTPGRKRSSYGVETEVKKWAAGCREQVRACAGQHLGS